MPNDDQEPGWGALSVLLWPVRAYVAVKQWVHDQLHPDEGGPDQSPDTKNR